MVFLFLVVIIENADTKKEMAYPVFPFGNDITKIIDFDQFKRKRKKRRKNVTTETQMGPIL